MKNLKILFGLIPIVTLLFSACSPNDDGGIYDGDDTPVLPCDNFNKDLLTLSTAFDNSLNAEINYNSFLINNLDSSQPIPQGNLLTNTNLTYQLPTSTSFYNESDKLHGIVISRAGKYFTFNTDSGTGQEFSVPTSISAPIELNNNGYVIEVANSGYALSGMGNHYEIKSFDIHTGTIGSTYPIDPMTKNFDNNSLFNVESMSAATNGTDKLYFLSGTNLVTVNTTLNTASHIDLYPSFSNLDYVRFFGLEYSESLGLIAIMGRPDQQVQNLIKIDPTNGNYALLLNLPTHINSEFYSSTYRECDKTYYLTSLSDSPIVKTNYFEFDLEANTISNTQIFQNYFFGIELVPVEEP